MEKPFLISWITMQSERERNSSDKMIYPFRMPERSLQSDLLPVRQ